MPELPDLEVFSHNLQKKLAGKKLKELRIKNTGKIRTSAANFKKTLENQTLKKVYREGKELYFEFSKADVLALHLMLHGELHLFEGTNDRKHAIIELIFSDNTGLVMTDFQGAATPTLNPEEKQAPDALSKTITAAFLRKTFQSSKAAIKNMLLDQKLIKGIGNAYADEILWEARISPFAAGNKIPDKKFNDLAKAIKHVLKQAQKDIRKAEPDIISGEIREFLKIHNSKKKKSPTGADIRIKSGSRKTYYTNEQEDYK
jgi:formamidopyrimidine-DNA glycosylase